MTPEATRGTEEGGSTPGRPLFRPAMWLRVAYTLIWVVVGFSMTSLLLGGNTTSARIGGGLALAGGAVAVVWMLGLRAEIGAEGVDSVQLGQHRHYSWGQITRARRRWIFVSLERRDATPVGLGPLQGADELVEVVNRRVGTA